MKFFWKLYFSIMTITLICFSVGGTMLIQTSFKNSFDREVESIYQENDILVNSLTLELYPYLEEIALKEDSTQERTNLLKNVFCNMIVETFRGNVSFCVRDENGNVIYQNDTFKDQHKLFKRISQNERGSIVLKDKNRYKLQVLRCFSLNETKLYFENVRDISELFLNRESQFRTLFYYTLVLLFVSTIVIFIVTRWLVYPIKKLSKATKGIADGQVFVPVMVSSEDEIGQLTKDFNTMAKRLEITMKELHEAAERQEMFVGNFAHELKTPLTSIIGYGDMLRSKCLSEEEIINYSHLIVEEGKRLESMSMKLLNLIVLKKQDFKMYKISAQTFFQGIEDTVDLLMKENNIQFITEIEPGELHIEPDLMKTVCLNLLDNARKAIGKNGKISLKGTVAKTGYQFVIEDNGCGMATDELDKIKEAFYMVDQSRSRSAGGAGLGLALCDQIIKLHHGLLDFESVLGKGTTVTVKIEGVINNEEMQK